MVRSELSAFVPEFHGTNDVGGISYIMLEDLTRGYTHPCVLDLKLGCVAQRLCVHTLCCYTSVLFG